MFSNLCKSFTSDAIELSQKKEFLAVRALQFTFSWRHIIVVSLISIAFVVVKLKISKFLRTDSTSTKYPFLGGFWVLAPRIWSNITEILTRGSKYSSQQKHLFLKDSRFMEKGRTTLALLFLPGWPKSKEISSSAETLQPLSHPNMLKWNLCLPSSFRQKYDYFLQYLGYFYQKTRRGSQVKEVESKFDKYCFIHTIPGELSVKTFWFKYFPVLRL